MGDEHRAVYERLRARLSDGSARAASARSRARRTSGDSAPFSAGRDPRSAGDVIDEFTTAIGWESPLAQGELLAHWPELVGPELAQRSRPLGIEDGVLTVGCDSTAWATQLRSLRGALLTKIISEYPEAGIRSVRVEGPGVPSWKRGPRSVPGRGPRDTYG